MSNEIDLSKCPVENYVKIYNPDGTLLVRTNSEIVFNYIRLEICKRSLVGYTGEIEETGTKFTINKYGRSESDDDTLNNELFMVNMKLSSEIIRTIVLKKKL